ncbi:unnamed protein product [Durusdinium trenchii]|uniref:EF-hand domain-containing protein n=1 Tax=Durusdinium trenchii TaxID=1381693 RepID=A0ABP0IV87_9DINO
MPVGNVAAIIAARRARRHSKGFRPTPVSSAEQRRLQAAIAERNRKVKLMKIIRTYDTNQSGKLERDQIVKLLTDTDSSTPPGTPPRILAKRVSINFSCKSFGRSTYCVDLHLDSFHLSSFGYALIRYLLEIHTTSFSFLPCQAPQPGRNAGRMLRKPSNRHIW